MTSLIQYAKILSKFGEQQQVMVNYACGFNQSETGKYFEGIIIWNISKFDLKNYPGVILRWTNIPCRGSRIQYFWSLHATETGISSGLMGHLGRMHTFLLYRFIVDCVY